MSDKLIRLLHPEIRQPADAAGEPIVEFVASDETVDRYDEVIVASGWKLDNYIRNPVFQNSHKYGDILFTLGKCTVVKIVAGQLVQRILFAVNANPMAKIAYDLYKGKFLNAVSVGFIPIKSEPGDKSTNYRRRFLEQELLELSAVSIPANPNALQLGFNEGAIEKSDIRELRDFLNQFCNDKAGPETHPRASGSGADVAQLLTLARSVNAMARA